MKEGMTAIVAAAASSRGIGYQGQLPWKLSGDMAHFKKVTSTPPAPGKVNAVVMGRTTWQSIPAAFRPLQGRTNVVLTRHPEITWGNQPPPQGVLTAKGLSDAVQQLEQLDNLGHVFLIGGAQVYEEALKEGLVNKVIYTQVDNLSAETKFDVFFPNLDPADWQERPFVGGDDKENGPTDSDEWKKDKKSGLTYRFVEFQKKQHESNARRGYSTSAVAEEEQVNDDDTTTTNHEEMQYLNLCRDIVDTGVRRGDRTGTGTLSLFGTQMRFSLRDGTLPLLTTKRTFWRGVAEELLWFVSGNTNANDLAAKNIHIWDGNGSREFLDSRGLQDREVGDLGPVYGFQWRHFGAKYVDMHTDYTGQGVDQLADCIDKIKNNPEDRRIVMSAWNPADLKLMALPPCHMFCQFYVDTEKNELSCQMYQRSADMGLGVPFNIASYALLTHMTAQVTGRKPGDFVHTIGDAHVYTNHVDALREQLQREPRPFPKLKINPAKKDIDDFVYEDFEVIGYNPHKTIKMKMAV